MDEKIKAIVIGVVRDLCDDDEEINNDTVLLGAGGILDSVGLVSLVVDVEEAVNDEFGTDLTLADIRAMSQKNSPFRTVGSLTKYIIERFEESK